MAGYIMIDRKILNWEWYHDLKVFHLFLYLLLKANHKDGSWQGVAVKRGQLITGRFKISSETRLSERQIRTCLDKLKTTNEIAIKTTKRYSIITICKYDYYQSSERNNDQQNDQQNAKKRPTNDQQNDQQTTTNNNGKNGKNDNNEKKEIQEGQFWFLKFYHSNYENYKTVFNGQSTTEDYFNQWKTFIDFIYEKKYEDIFDCKFVNPQDFEKLIKKEKFTKDKWDETIKRILATGVKPEHNLFFRIPQFMEYGKKEQPKPEKVKLTFK